MIISTKKVVLSLLFLSLTSSAYAQVDKGIKINSEDWSCFGEERPCKKILQKTPTNQCGREKITLTPEWCNTCNKAVKIRPVSALKITGPASTEQSLFPIPPTTLHPHECNSKTFEFEINNCFEFFNIAVDIQTNINSKCRGYVFGRQMKSLCLLDASVECRIGNLSGPNCQEYELPTKTIDVPDGCPSLPFTECIDVDPDTCEGQKLVYEFQVSNDNSQTITFDTTPPNPISISKVQKVVVPGNYGDLDGNSQSHPWKFGTRTNICSKHIPNAFINVFGKVLTPDGLSFDKNYQVCSKFDQIRQIELNPDNLPFCCDVVLPPHATKANALLAFSRPISKGSKGGKGGKGSKGGKGKGSTKNPSRSPSTSPTTSPTQAPTQYPTKAPTKAPSKSPTKAPTESPTLAPTEFPTKYPTKAPTKAPSKSPTKYPTESPTQAPTKAPTQYPTKAPTKAPTQSPTEAPTESPTQSPTITCPAIIPGACSSGSSTTSSIMNSFPMMELEYEGVDTTPLVAKVEGMEKESSMNLSLVAAFAVLGVLLVKFVMKKRDQGKEGYTKIENDSM